MMLKRCSARPCCRTSSTTNLPNSSRHSSPALCNASANTAAAAPPAHPSARECRTSRSTMRQPYLCLDAQPPWPTSSSAMNARRSEGITSKAFFTTWFACGCCTASTTCPLSWPSNASASNCTRHHRAGAASCRARATIAMARCTARLEAPSLHARAQTRPSPAPHAASFASAMTARGSAAHCCAALRDFLARPAGSSASSSSQAAWSYSGGQERSTHGSAIAKSSQVHAGSQKIGSQGSSSARGVSGHNWQASEGAPACSNAGALTEWCMDGSSTWHSRNVRRTRKFHTAAVSPRGLCGGEGRAVTVGDWPTLLLKQQPTSAVGASSLSLQWPPSLA
mmetsp:Transcript_124095/g.347510  ORF Transcript_124095/g.347510 Transcript_124095/m.347510 type:complete len:338 (+) Transcript_124095:577-1590(+)